MARRLANARRGDCGCAGVSNRRRLLARGSRTLRSTEPRKQTARGSPERWYRGLCTHSRALFQSSGQAPEQRGEGSGSVPRLGPSIRRRSSKLLDAAPRGGGGGAGDQMFEAHMQSYKGDDPLGEWESYMQWVEENFPENKEYLTTLLEHLMKEFLDKKRYHNDPRFINYCLKFAECNSDLHQFFEFLYNHGIGTQSAPLYVAWAGHLEGRGQWQHASAVFRRGIQNQAEPGELLQQQYRLFQTRLTETHVPTQAAADVQQVVMYCKEKLIRGESEFSFEELRAQKYNQRRKHEQWAVSQIVAPPVSLTAQPMTDSMFTAAGKDARLPQPKNKPAGARTFGERSMSRFPSKPNEVPHTEELLDDSTVWGVRCTRALAPSPRSPGDFTAAARLASTPFHKPPVDSGHPLEDKENVMARQYTHVTLDSCEGNTVEPSKEGKCSPVQEKSLEPAFPTELPSASLLRLGQPSAAVLTSEAERGLEACKLTDPDFVTAEGPSDTSVRPQAGQMQIGPLRNIDVPSMNRCSILIAPQDEDSSLVQATP
ncbi:hypothetical protein CB1_000688006 [Camelus ferus]|nr:hypothetical protein CB1_000688006 [Camelus ferus]